MSESEKIPSFDRWMITDDSHITLESPYVAIGSGHLEVYLEDPDGAFGGLGIAIKMVLPESVTQVFRKCEAQGKKLHVYLTVHGIRHDFILVNRPDAGRYPWRLQLPKE
ncbi:hypothetical protein HY626_01360 [Candidatus Uhrbacteria bacterium]|nr:hypothetical protein [Candidatus Uhrbacteria bacterium]